MFRMMVLVGIVSAAPCVAFAFGTINTLGQSAEHERITRIALKTFGFGPKTLSLLAGRTGTFGAVGAPDNPIRGLISKPIAHCDGGDTLAVQGYPQSETAARRRLSRCRKWIFDHLDKAVRSAGALVDKRGRIDTRQIPSFIPCVFNGKKGRGKCNVLDAMGVALHAAQDFYSHTNWTDRADDAPVGPTNPPGLANTGPARWLDPRHRSKFPDGLMSGCFEGIPESRHCKYGNGKLRVRHKALNKDKGRIDVRRGSALAAKTSRGRIKGNFRRAVAAAVADTRNKWSYLEQRIKAVYGARRGRIIVCALKRDDPSSCT